MRLTKQTSNAIRILITCARAGGRVVPMAEIARANAITTHNVAKIAPLLVQAGFVSAARGRAGGLTLARAADDIRMGDVVVALEAVSLQAACTGEEFACAIRPLTPVNRMLEDARTAFLAELNSHTLADMIVPLSMVGGDDVRGTLIETDGAIAP